MDRNSILAKKSGAKDGEEVEVIEREIAKCLQDIDPRYYSPNFNLIGEIVNVFGDINFEKVKVDIDRLNKIDEKLDKVIKLIVDRHSEEFFRILGFVRQMQREIEHTKLRLSESQDFLNNINTIISSLSTGENTEWKLKSVYCSEIISKLNKTQQIFKIISDCEIYIQNNKILDAINLLKRTSGEHLNYDKEFRNFNLLVSINIRFKKIEENIEDKIITNLSNILFFSQEHVLERKIGSLMDYFLTYYSKISIDNELAKPLQKFMFIIKNVVNNNLANSQFDTETDDIDHYLNENIVDLDTEKKLSSLVYLTRCLRNYDRSFQVFLKINDRIHSELGSLLERTIKHTTEALKLVDFSKYDLDSKTDKLKFLLFFQIFLMIVFHTYSKLISIVNYVKNKEITELGTKLFTSVEKLSSLPLAVYYKMVGPRQSSEGNETSLEVEYVQSESIIRMKINDILTNNIENLPILFKIYNKFCDSSFKLFDTKLTIVTDQLYVYSQQLYQY